MEPNNKVMLQKQIPKKPLLPELSVGTQLINFKGSLSYLLLLLISFLPEISFCQGQIDLIESTFKVGSMGSEEFYFGFAEGDQIIFSFEELKGKELKEVEIIEYPSTPKFMDYKTKKIEKKAIVVLKRGVYKFKFSNAALAGRICKVKISRVPATEVMRNFNTNVYWKTLLDTSYYLQEERYLISKDTTVIPVIAHQVERVHSKTSTNGNPNKSFVKVSLPTGTIYWSYYLGVGDNAETVFKKAEEKAKKTIDQLNAASTIANKIALVDPSGSAALASLAFKGYAEFGVAEKADNIQYWFVQDYTNAALFMNGNPFYMIDNGNGPLCAKRMINPLAGTFYLCLLNDNIREGIDVHVRISAVTYKENWGLRQVRKFSIKPLNVPYLEN